MAELTKGSKRIIITSESVNYYRFRVLTDGIDLAQYEKNPVMLWMHIRAVGNAKDIILPLGNVIELRREIDPILGKVITGLPAFDLSDDFAKRIYEKYENGTIRMASAGLRPVAWSDDPEYILVGQTGATLIESIMEEVSLCDIGGNNDALQVALYNDANERIELSLKGENAAIPLIKNLLIENEMLKIELTADKAAFMLGVKEIATAEQFERNVAEVVQLAATQKTQIEKLTQEKANEEAKVLQLTNDLKGEQTKNLEESKKVLLNLAVTERKISKDEISFYAEQITDQESFDRVKLHLDGKAGSVSVQSILGGSKTSDEKLVNLCKQGYDELFKSGELEYVKLHANEEYARIYKDKFKKDPKKD